MASGPDPIHTVLEWLDQLDADELRDLIGAAVFRVDGVGAWLDVQRVARCGDADELLAIVNRVMTPHRRFYDYRQANEYAYDCTDTVDLLTDAASHGSSQLIRVIERAITLTTRAILKSDDSSGLQGDVVRTLLHAHATATVTTVPPLSQAEQSRLVRWIVSYRYNGKQDFFDPDIVAYAPGLSEKSIEQYRSAITKLDLHSYARYPFTRLAVLDRDCDALVAAHGGEPNNAMVAARLVDDLEESGLHDDAIVYAKRGVGLEQHGWDQSLVTFLVDDAVTRKDCEGAVTIRRDWFTRFPTAMSFKAFRSTAEQVGNWACEQDAAEARLAVHDGSGYVSYLVSEGRIDQAWDYACANIPVTQDSGLWLDLCHRRAQTCPSDTLPVYRSIVTDTLTVTDKRNYRVAAKILKSMRTAAAKTSETAVREFELFLAETVDQNRRRPTCIDTFIRAGLIPKR